MFPHTKEWFITDEKGNKIPKSRNERVKKLDDDLPKVSEAYREYLKGVKR